MSFLQFTSDTTEAEPHASHDDTATGGSSNVLRLNELLTGRQGLLMSTFSNAGIMLKLYLILPVTNCEGERSFLNLSRIKSHLHSSICQNCLSALSLLLIESELLQLLYYNDTIDDFASEYARKSAFNIISAATRCWSRQIQYTPQSATVPFL